MKKWIVVFVFITICIGGFIAGKDIKYSTDDCVVYFDEEAKYQLTDGGNRYYLFDAERGQSLCPNVKSYIKINECVYAVFDKPVGVDIYERGYGILNVETGQLNLYTDISVMHEKDASIFNGNDMIQLKKTTDIENYFRNITPIIFRKR